MPRALRYPVMATPVVMFFQLVPPNTAMIIRYSVRI